MIESTTITTINNSVHLDKNRFFYSVYSASIIHIYIYTYVCVCMYVLELNSITIRFTGRQTRKKKKRREEEEEEKSRGTVQEEMKAGTFE